MTAKYAHLLRAMEGRTEPSVLVCCRLWLLALTRIKGRHSTGTKKADRGKAV